MRAGQLRIATRSSPLALWQAEHVRTRLLAAHPQMEVLLTPMTTTGDRMLAGPLAEVGGKGLFVKELEEAMLAGRAELAVHSMKDVPAQQPEGLMLAAFLAGEDPRDAFVANEFGAFDDLPQGARLGTSSLRRQTLARGLRPDLEVRVLRGNVGTRLRKLDESGFDAILLACAGLDRLGLAARIRERLDVERFVPAIGQGVIGIECRSDDPTTRAAVAALHDTDSGDRLAAERALGAALGGSCQVPVAGHARVQGDRLSLIALVGSPDGRRQVRGQLDGDRTQAARLGADLAKRLLMDGAAEILRELGALD